MNEDAGICPRRRANALIVDSSFLDTRVNSEVGLLPAASIPLVAAHTGAWIASRGSLTPTWGLVRLAVIGLAVAPVHRADTPAVQHSACGEGRTV